MLTSKVHHSKQRTPAKNNAGVFFNNMGHKITECATNISKKMFPPKYFKNDIEEYKNMKTKPVLFVRHLTKRYSKRSAPAIENVSINVYPGEFHAFIGANGAGKTTSMKSIIGGYVNWSGTVLINGINSNLEAAKAKIGYIPETPRFPAQFTSFEYLVAMMELSGIDPKEAQIRATRQLKLDGLWKLRDVSPNTFSSGQKKKILLAQALVHSPNIILMDEPVANLDPQARGDFFRLLTKLRTKGVSILISSHVLAELDLYFDSVTIIDGGHTVYENSKEKMREEAKITHYSVKTSNDVLLKEYLRKIAVQYHMKKENKCINVNISNPSDLIKIETFMSQHKISIDTFIREPVTLDALYKKMVIKGSVDTMKKKGKK